LRIYEHFGHVVFFHFPAHGEISQTEYFQPRWDDNRMYAFSLEIQSCLSEKSLVKFYKKIVASSWWWHLWDRKCPIFDGHHPYLTTKQIWAK
jgi:hypothetical protein